MCVRVCVCFLAPALRKNARKSELSLAPAFLGRHLWHTSLSSARCRPPGGRLREIGTPPVPLPGGRLREMGTPHGSLSMSVEAPSHSGSRTGALASFFVFATFAALFDAGSVDDDDAGLI